MSRDVVPDRPVPGHAVCLDLRAEAYDPEDRYGPDAAVRRALAAPQPAGERRFLVVDDADRLVGHQLLHERLSSYGPARVVCLAVGAPEERTLRRTLTLRPPAAGVLWLLDGFHGPDAAALRPLVDVLATPEVFDAVLEALCRVADGVAVPSVRIVEHDLSDEARARAWRQAVAALTGPDVPAAGSVGTVPGELAPLLDESVPGSLAGHDWLPAQGRVGARLRACADALEEAVDGHARVRGPAGLLTRRAAGTDLPAAVERLGTALRGVRDSVADVLAVAGGPRPSTEERGLLADRGVRLPELPREVTRTGTVPALRDHTRELIARRLPLRSVAARLSALAARTAPAGSAARLTTLDRICGPARLDRLSAQHPFLAGGSRPVAAAVTALLALLAGLWPVLGWVLGPAVGLLAAALAHRTLRHRPNRSPDGRLDGGGSAGVAPRLAGGLAGGLAGAVLGHLLVPPLWVGALTLPVAVGCVVLLALRDWTRAVDDWWDRADPRDAGRALQEVRALVATTAVHDWLFAEVRHHCSDGAGAVARLLRGLAVTADTHPGPDEGGSGSGNGGKGGGAGSRADAHATTVPHRTGPVDEPPAESGWDWDDWSDDTAPGAVPSSDGWFGDAALADAPLAGTPAADDRFAGTPPDDGAFIGGPPREDAFGGPGADPPDPVVAPGRPEPAWLERRYGDGGPELVDTLAEDLVEGVTAILDGCWAGIERDPGNAGRLRLDGPMTALLDETRTRLEWDAAASPPAGREDRGRPDAARLTGVAPDGVTRLLAADDDRDATVPLCGPEHLRLLSQDPGAVRRVRFVPETMRRGTTGDDIWRHGTEDVVWTDAGRHAGVLRLVPLRADVVRTIRAEEDAAP
ncbi:serine/threonine-protein kinase [Streptomyces laurentii]|uniref:hypothetical protein n=1 Tax=Streptomyces laurentii TaxID=39478 RepID=UPI0036955EB1